MIYMTASHDNNLCYDIVESLLDIRISSDSRKDCRHHDWPHNQCSSVSHIHIYSSVNNIIL